MNTKIIYFNKKIYLEKNCEKNYTIKANFIKSLRGQNKNMIGIGGCFSKEMKVKKFRIKKATKNKLQRRATLEIENNRDFTYFNDSKAIVNWFIGNGAYAKDLVESLDYKDILLDKNNDVIGMIIRNPIETKKVFVGKSVKNLL